MSPPFKDHFSGHAADYAKYRPVYPREMFEYLGSIAPSRELAWDCATGNGQAAQELAKVFRRVIATDASAKQIAAAEPTAGVEYQVATAEESGLPMAAADLIMVAQALHWFELDRFYSEARRVLKPDGILAVTAYNLLTIAPAIDQVVGRFYSETVGPWWPPERKFVEQFADLPFAFPELETPDFEMKVDWDLDQLVHYLGTWSATQRFMAEKHFDPLPALKTELEPVWGEATQKRSVVWPLTLRVGRNDRGSG